MSSTTSIKTEKGYSYKASDGKKHPKVDPVETILGRAREALDQSRQFRESPSTSNPMTMTNPSRVLPPTSWRDANVFNRRKHDSITTVPTPSNFYRSGSYFGNPHVAANSKTEPSVTVNSKLYYRPGTATQFTKKVNQDSASDESDLDSDRSHRSHSDTDISSSSSDESLDDEDDSTSSTITPPTITDTHPSVSLKKDASSSQNNSQVNTNLNTKVIPVSEYDKNHNFPVKERKRKNALEAPPLLRGEPVSHESYAVIKEMMNEKERQLVPVSYSEDWVSEIHSVTENEEMLSESIEIPKTELSEDLEIPIDSSQSLNTSTPKDTMSSLLVEEIKVNLQDLDISDRTNVAEDEDEDEEAGLSVEDRAIAELELKNSLQLSDEGEEEDKDSATLVSESPTEPRSRSTTSKLQSSSKRASIPSTSGTGQGHVSKHSKSIKKPSTNVTSNTTTAEGKSWPSFPKEKESSLKKLQEILTHVNLGDETKIISSPKGKDVDYIYKPPETNPQNQIQTILEKEVYLKELSRLRYVQKQVDRGHGKQKMKQLVPVNPEALAGSTRPGAHLEQDHTHTKVPKPKTKVKEGPIASSSNSNSFGFGIDFKLDGSLSSTDDFGNYSLALDKSYIKHVEQMGVPQLVKEVMASNERMYKMTMKAAREMQVQYGKDKRDAKILRRLKRVKENERRLEKD